MRILVIEDELTIADMILSMGIVIFLINSFMSLYMISKANKKLK